MRCPKCNVDIDDKALVCPNCKKVLKLLCPKCGMVNKTNQCKKCGFVIVSKCHKCGKINKTIDEKCSKCGFSTHTSVALSTSNIEEFACLTVEFPNLEQIKPIFKSTQLEEKFKKKLDQLVLGQVSEFELTKEIIDKIYVIRFNKNYSYKKSAENAMAVGIEILNAVNELNEKLDKLKNVALECKIAVLKRNVYAKPDEYKSGLNIKLIDINSNKTKLKSLKGVQFITDSHIYEQVANEYDLKSLNATFIKNEMVMFFELNVPKYISKAYNKKKVSEEFAATNFNVLESEVVATIDPSEELYDIDVIKFNEIRCDFAKVKSMNLVPEIVETFKQKRKKIVSIKGESELRPRTEHLLNQLENANCFKNIYKVTCHDEMKYKPYGFFYELISCIYGFSSSPKNFNQNNFEHFNAIDSSDFMKNLINLTERQFPHPEDVRYSLFDIFYDLFAAMSNSLIYIENFEKIDETSLEVLQIFLDKFDNFDLSYLVLTSKDFQLHKLSHSILANPDYLELTVKPTSFKEIVQKNIKKYENILDSFYLQKIAQNSQGSMLYLSHAIEFLMEQEFLNIKDGVFSIDNFENILIPNTLDELIVKRLRYLETRPDTFKLFCKLLLIGSRIDSSTFNLLNADKKLLLNLIDKKYIYVQNDNIYISNYSLIKDNFLSAFSLKTKQQISAELIEEVFSFDIKHPTEALLYNILEHGKQEFIVWEKLSRLNASMGDFSAYLHCSIKFLKLLDKHVDENSQKTIEEYKMEVYENISNLLYKYTPNEVYNITQVVLNNLENTADNKKLLNLYNKMLQGCFIGGNYSYAINLIHKILETFSDTSINPQDSNFNVKFFLVALVKIEILFSIGNFKDCVEAGEEILNVLAPPLIPQLRPENLSEKQFEAVIFDAMSFVALSKILLLQVDLKEFIEKIQKNIGFVPKVFDMFLILEKIIKGQKVLIPTDEVSNDDKFSKVIISIIKAFGGENIDYAKFADNIYQAKLSAKMTKLTQIEFICDLLIGYSYFKLNQEDKASSIYYNVLEASTKNGLKMVTYLDWYLISMLKFEQQDIEVAFGIAHNAVIQLEKDHGSGDFLFFLFRILLAKIFVAKDNTEAAESCMNDAKFIKEKYGLNYEVT